MISFQYTGTSQNTCTNDTLHLDTSSTCILPSPHRTVAASRTSNPSFNQPPIYIGLILKCKLIKLNTSAFRSCTK